jgi:hypothetical protein
MNTRTRTAATPAASSTPVAPSILVKEHTADLDTGDLDLGVHDKSVDLGMEFSLEQIRDQLNAGAASVDSPDFKGFAETMAFMEERVLVRVATSNEQHAEKIVEVYNNGVPQFFVRGEWVIARRKYVEILARAKPFSVTTPEAMDARGNRTNRIETHNGQRYPFEMKDTNPLGAAWLNAIFMEQ